MKETRRSFAWPHVALLVLVISLAVTACGQEPAPTQVAEVPAVTHEAADGSAQVLPGRPLDDHAQDDVARVRVGVNCAGLAEWIAIFHQELDLFRGGPPPPPCR